MTSEATTSLPTTQGEHREERVFLKGPQPRSWELWMLGRILREFLRGFRVLHFVGPCITVFGSARFSEDHPYYVSRILAAPRGSSEAYGPGRYYRCG